MLTHFSWYGHWLALIWTLFRKGNWPKKGVLCPWHLKLCFDTCGWMLSVSYKSIWFLSINPICPAPLALLLSAYKYTLVCSGLGQVALLAHCPVQCYCPIFYFKLVLALKITTINVNFSCFHSVYQLIDDLDSDKTLEDMGHTLNTFVTQSWRDCWKHHEVPSSRIWYKKCQIVKHQGVSEMYH